MIADQELDAIATRILTALADSAELSVGDLTSLLQVPYGRIEPSIEQLLSRGHIASVPRGGLSPAYRAVNATAGSSEMGIELTTRGPDRDGDVRVEGRATNRGVDRLEQIQITVDARSIRGEPNGFRTIYPSPADLDPGASASFSTYVRLNDPGSHGSVQARVLSARHVAPKVVRTGSVSSSTYRTFLDTYTVVRQHGQGGSGVVLEVTSSGGDRLALKRLALGGTTSERIKRFRQEAGWCERTRHPNLVRVVDRGIVEPGGDLFYVMRFFPATLRNAIKARVEPALALRLFLQVLDGLEVAHRADVVHRDIKPENLLYDPSEVLVVVADFGIAHFAEEELLTTIETGPAERLANFGYAAPEQRVRGQTIDQRTDIFALGSVLNELFTGKAVHGPGYPPISSADPAYGYLDSVVDRMVQQDPSARPASIQEVRTAIEDARGKPPVEKNETVDTSSPNTAEGRAGLRAEAFTFSQLSPTRARPFVFLVSNAPRAYTVEALSQNIGEDPSVLLSILEFLRDYDLVTYRDSPDGKRYAVSEAGQRFARENHLT